MKKIETLAAMTFLLVGLTSSLNAFAKSNDSHLPKKFQVILNYKDMDDNRIFRAEKIDQKSTLFYQSDLENKRVAISEMSLNFLYEISREAMQMKSNSVHLCKQKYIELIVKTEVSRQSTIGCLGSKTNVSESLSRIGIYLLNLLPKVE